MTATRQTDPNGRSRGIAAVRGGKPDGGKGTNPAIRWLAFQHDPGC
jgi:hypothetical protein